MTMNSKLVTPSILVSACLLGNNCRYNGESYDLLNLNDSLKQFSIIPVCPEVLGGLSTPRPPSEISTGNGDDVWTGIAAVMTKKGLDLTAEFKAGALKTLELSRKYNAKIAILKDRSPSCGCYQIYDGTFSGRLVYGCGVTVSLLKKNKIRIISEKNWQSARGE